MRMNRDCAGTVRQSLILVCCRTRNSSRDLPSASALPLMQTGASIVLNTSIGSTKGIPATSVYSGTKAAVRSFARIWAVDLKDRKIRVNAVSPGVIPTPGYNALGLTQDQIDQYVQGLIRNVPSGRPGTPDEIAKVVAFLASDDASYVNGIELPVDGGLAQI
jgi:NAD(P)-dependent dehydrogenase (short-subunit alcohol dehydrogenase family)